MIYFPGFLVILVSYHVILQTFGCVARYEACFSCLLRFIPLFRRVFRLIFVGGCRFEIVYGLFVGFLAACIYLLLRGLRCLSLGVLLHLLLVLVGFIAFQITNAFRLLKCELVHEIKSYVLGYGLIFRAFLSVRLGCLIEYEPFEVIPEGHLIILMFLEFWIFNLVINC